jgi:hypothetical protein
VPPNAVEPVIAALRQIQARGRQAPTPRLLPGISEGGGPYAELYRELAGRMQALAATPPAAPERWLALLLAGGPAPLPSPAETAEPSPDFAVLVDCRDPAADAAARAATVASLPAPGGTLPRLLSWGAAIPPGWAALTAGEVNAELATLTSRWLLVIPAGCELAADWPGRIGEALAAAPEARLLYWDEALLTPRGERYAPLHKPAYDPLLFAERPAMLHGAFLVDRDHLLADGGLQPGTPPLPAATLARWQAAAPGCIRHLPGIGSHWRDETYWARLRAALPSAGHLPPNETLPAIGGARLDAVVLSQDGQESTRLVGQLLQQEGIAWGSLQPCWLGEALPAHIRAAGHPRIRPWRCAADLAAALQALPGDSEWLFLATDALFLERPDVLARLLAARASTPQATLLVPRLADRHGRLFAAGWLPGGGPDGIVSPYGAEFGADPVDDLNLATARRPVGAASPVCVLLRRDVLAAWTPTAGVRHTYAFVDLCLQLRAAGRSLCCAGDIYAHVLPHGESPHGLADHQAPAARQAEGEAMLARWGGQLAADPLHNPNLALRGDPRLPDPRFPVAWHGRRKARPCVAAAPFDHWASGHYRVRDPLRQLTRTGAVAHVLLPTPEARYVPSVTEMRRSGADVLLAHNPFHDFQLRALAAYRRHLGLRIVVGMDDLLTAIPPYNAYAHTLYPDIAARIAQALALCDLLVVSTRALADAYGPLAPRCQVIGNAIDAGRWPAAAVPPPGRRLRVGWAGAMNHGGDLEFLAEVVAATCATVDWHFLGEAPAGLPAGSATVEAMVPFDAYPARLAALGLDLALAPLADNAFNRAKSPLKLFEYGMLDLPVIASDLPPYRDAPVLRLPNEPASWARQILADAAAPAQAAARGRELGRWVRQGHLLADTAALWLAALTGTD